MRAGRLDRRIRIERKSVSQSITGDPVETWTTLSTRWASVVPVRGDERFTDPQLAAKEQVEFRIRWSQDVADLSPPDRIAYPVLSGSPDTGSLYDILAVHEIGRREGLRIIAFRRTDV